MLGVAAGATRLLRIAQMGSAWARGAEVLGYAPKQVSIEPTNVCNYRCTFCPQSDPLHHERVPRGYMSLPDLDAILDKVIAVGAAWNRTISFTHDGEPLIHPQFPEFVRHANDRGLQARFSSNGSKLTALKVAELVDAGSFLASIDFSGSPEAFEKHRGKPGHWALVRENLAHLIHVSNAHPTVRLEVSEMGGIDGDGPALLERMKAALTAPTSDRVEFRVRSFHNAAGTITLRRPGNASAYRRCPYPWVSFVIAWNGDVHACCRDLEGRTKLGNVLEAASLWDIWNGEPYQAFRRSIADRQPEKMSACATCDMPWSGDPRKWAPKNIVRALRKR